MILIMYLLAAPANAGYIFRLPVGFAPSDHVQAHQHTYIITIGYYRYTNAGPSTGTWYTGYSNSLPSDGAIETPEGAPGLLRATYSYHTATSGPRYKVTLCFTDVVDETPNTIIIETGNGSETVQLAFADGNEYLVGRCWQWNRDPDVWNVYDHGEQRAVTISW